MDLTWYPSPNHGPRRGCARPHLVVLHYTAMATAQTALDRLCMPEHQVSAHYLIGEQGQIWQLVDEARRAWHAGAGAWGSISDVNSASVGIELANPGDVPFSAAQMAALEGLLKSIRARWDLAQQAVIGHSDMAPGRKADPGGKFDWRRLARIGLSVWPRAQAPETADPVRFQAAARRFGYAVPDLALQAFRLRFRPWIKGAPLDGWDVAWAEDLARHHPALDQVDAGA